MVNISLRRRPSRNSSLPMMLIARTLDLSPSVISNTRSTRFWSSWTIFGSTVRGEAALAPVQLDDPVDVGADLGAGEDLARRELDLGQDLVVLDPLVALKDDAVDDRVFADRDHQIAGVGAGDDDVGEQLGRVEILERLIERFGGIVLARGRGWHRRGPFPARGARRRDTGSSGSSRAVATGARRGGAAPALSAGGAVAWAARRGRVLRQRPERTSRRGWSRPEERAPIRLV